MTRKISKILLYVCLTVLVALIAAAGFTQTSAFKQTLRSTLYKLAESNLNGSIFIGEIKGNLITGLSIDTLALYVNNAPFVEARNIAVRYDPFPLWKKRVAVASVEIDNPSVTFIKFGDGTWNIDRLSKKKSEPDSVPSSWVVALKSLRINNAHFRLIDSTTRFSRDLPDSVARHTIDFANLDIQKINIDLSASISENEQVASINAISFVSRPDGFRLTNLSGEVRHTPTGSEVKHLLIVTPLSHIELDASMNTVDVFKIKDVAALQSVPVGCSLTSSTVAATDLQRFLPSLNFLRGTVQVDCSVEGEFGMLRVKKLQTSFNHSKIDLKGSVMYLHHPKDLTLNIESKGTVIYPSDVPSLLPFFHIPDYGGAGPIAFDFHYVGKPLDFQVGAHLSMAAGELNVNGGLILTNPIMKYHADVRGRGVNIEKFLQKKSLQSHLDFSGTIEGEGTSIEELNSRGTISIDSSTFNDIPISRLRASVSAVNKNIQMSAKIRSPKGDVDLESALDYSLEKSPGYSFAGTFTHCRLESILKEDHYSSDLSFSLNARGDDFLHEGMNGALSIQFLPSQFGSYAFDSARAECRLELDSLGGKRLSFLSPIADVSLSGNFTYEGVVELVTAHLGALKRTYNQQMAIFDSSAVPSAADTSRMEPGSGAAASGQTTDLHYSVHLKNLEPLAIFTGKAVFNAVGVIQGTLRGTVDTLSAEGSIFIRSGKYSQNGSILFAESLFVNYDLQRLTRDSLFSAEHSPTILVRMRAANFLAGDSYFRNAVTDFTLHNRKAEYSLQCEIDSTIKFGIDGRASLTPSTYNLIFDTFSFRYKGYELDAAKRFSAHVSSAGISVDSAKFIHQDEQLVVGGSLDFNGQIRAIVRVSGFTLSNIYHFGRSQDFKSSALLFGGTATAQVTLTGTLKSPLIVCGLEVSDLSYRGTEFGYVNSTLNYGNKAVDLTLQLSKSPQVHDDYEFLCSGSIPMDLAIDTVSNRFDLPGLDLYFKVSKFDISIIDPFIAQLDRMKGTMEGSVHCTGSLDAPSFDGGLELRNAEFLFPMNNMSYQASGKIDIQGNRVLFSSFSARNRYEDYSSGKLDLGGYIVLHGFVPAEYHLTAMGELMVLQETSRSDQGVYGDLITSTGNDGLSFDGTYARSRVAGSLFVKQASLTFPSARQASNFVSSRYVNVVVVDDTSRPAVDTLPGPNLFAFLRTKKDTGSANEPSFLDGLGYDLVIQTQGIVQVRMVFNAATNEELFAELNGKLGLSKEGNNVRLTGTITVSEKSNYKFYKQFDAAGTLRFTGVPDNPELNIKATYTGSHIKAENPALKAQDPTIAPLTEKVIVSLAITGTRIDPKVKIGLSTVDENGNETERTGDVESDAISFLLTSTPGTPGKFRDDLTSNDKQGIANSLGGSIGGSLITGFTNTLLSGMMQDFLRANNINVVNSFELRYSGTSPDLRLSGVIGNAYWTFGGKVFNDINNTNVSLQWSLGSIIQDEKLRNFMFEVERKTDPLETSDLRRPTSGARIYYRFAF